MRTELHQKIQASHLERDAFLYVRQSSLRQVMENQESTKRQYALRERAVALGWPIERIHIIDSDLGQSGSQAAGRDGFTELVNRVAMGEVGIVWVWKSLDWPGTTPTGIACWNWRDSPAHSSWMKMASTIPCRSTTGCCWA